MVYAWLINRYKPAVLTRLLLYRLRVITVTTHEQVEALGCFRKDIMK